MSGARDVGCVLDLAALAGMTEQDRALATASYWAACAAWWARRLPNLDAAISVGRNLERLDTCARNLPREYEQRAKQLSDAIERAALLPR